MDVNEYARKAESFFELDPNMQMSTMLVFIFIAQRGKCNQRDIERELNMTNGSVSRNVSYWSDNKGKGKPGLGFVTREEDPMDRRFNNLKLTDAGLEFWRKFQERQSGKAKG